MDRSRGGLTTRIQALVDAQGRPIRLALTPGEAGDAPAALAIIDNVAPAFILVTDRAYAANAIGDHPRVCGPWANIPHRVIRKYDFAFGPLLSRECQLVER